MGQQTDPHESMIDMNLFAGGGGLAVGLKMAGFSPTHYYDFDSYSCETLCHNVNSGKPTIEGPVNERDVRDIDWRSLGRPASLAIPGS